MSAAVQTLDISPVGRVEGDLDVRVDISDGVVTNAWTNAEMFRGFEVILKDKDPQAGLVVTPRACGICGASHLTCAAWALDTAWGTTVPRNAILARNLGQIVESIQSLPRHHYGLFMIDYTNKNYSNSSFFEEAVKRYSPFTGTSYEAGVTISGRPVEIYALLGGLFWVVSMDLSRYRAIVVYLGVALTLLGLILFGELDKQHGCRLTVDELLDHRTEDINVPGKLNHRIVDQLDRRWVELHDVLGGIHGLVESREMADAHHLVLRDRRQLQLDRC